MDIHQALQALGPDTKTVAATLKEKGIKGRPTDGAACPISEYLIQCGFTGVWVAGQAHYNVDGGGRAHTELPMHVARFIYKFDIGYYPDLEEKS